MLLFKFTGCSLTLFGLSMPKFTEILNKKAPATQPILWSTRAVKTKAKK